MRRKHLSSDLDDCDSVVSIKLYLLLTSARGQLNVHSMIIEQHELRLYLVDWTHART